MPKVTMLKTDIANKSCELQITSCNKTSHSQIHCNASKSNLSHTLQITTFYKTRCTQNLLLVKAYITITVQIRCDTKSYKMQHSCI